MQRSVIAVVLSVVLVLTLSACSNDKSLKELKNELEVRTLELETLASHSLQLENLVESITGERDKLKYERDAFLEENLELRAEKKNFEAREKSFVETLGVIFTLTNSYREDLADIEEYVMASEDLPSFSSDIREDHRNLMYSFFADYMENIKLNTAFLIDAEPILFIIHVDTMNSDDLHRPARENCTYYKVAYYQSLVDYNGQDATVPIPRGFSDGLITHWLVEVEDMETGPAVTIFEPNV